MKRYEVHWCNFWKNGDFANDKVCAVHRRLSAAMRHVEHIRGVCRLNDVLYIADRKTREIVELHGIPGCAHPGNEDRPHRDLAPHVFPFIGSGPNWETVEGGSLYRHWSWRLVSA